MPAPRTISEFVPYTTDASLPGRKWLSHDGPVLVLERRTSGGLYFVRRSDGREHAIRPEFIRMALDESEITNDHAPSERP